LFTVSSIQIADFIASTQNVIDNSVIDLASKVLNFERLSVADALILYHKAPLPLLGMLADYIRYQKNGNDAYFVRNFHVEPTNICVHECLFCSYNHRYAGQSWEISKDELIENIRKADPMAVEVHITGGVHPKRDIYYYADFIKTIKQERPNLHIKAYSAIELDYMFQKSQLSINEGLEILRSAGLDSIPGGGAEVFDPEVRKQICNDKTSGERYLEIHKVAHQMGIPSNTTILYGHIETIEQRLDHLLQLRDLQDITNGFMAFIPLKFRNKNNRMSHIAEVSVTEDLRFYALTRLFLDNFAHLKAYWPMLGKPISQLMLAFGVDDLDGTIEDTTRIYTLAGAEEQNPGMTSEEFAHWVRQAGRVPVERNSYYQKIKSY
jgi:aminodeoxyfutalosine synthase